MAKKLPGLVFYRGPSEIDGSPIVAIATLQSANSKTGNMIQTWILRSDQHPVEAVQTGDDAAICGACPLRGLLGKRGCYVNVSQAPTAIYAAFKAGNYPQFDPCQCEHVKYLRGRTLRLGAYGDPAAVPLQAWRPLLSRVAGRTGYTHQWKTCDPGWRDYVMASVESVKDLRTAQNAGWRTFRARGQYSPLAPGEIVCPASKEGGERLTCETCLACDGGRVSKASVSVIAHGGITVMQAVAALVS